MTPDFQIEGDPKTTRIVVAMSGGVDSSVAAALAKRAGYDVVGVTLQLYNHGEAVQKKGACCAGSDIHDARTVAAKIGIPHFVLDYEERFRAQVIEPFADSYARGETPVPCISCNQTVKFKDLLSTAKDLGGAALVTGHYIESRSTGNHRAMYRAHDAERDQSYFLYATTQEQLDYLRFPLGGLAKPAVRAIAEELGLIVANKPDSQDICFVPSGRYTTIIDRLKPDAAEAGEIVHLDGRVLGKHAGIIHYTVGQRRGLNIAEGEPLYVIRLDAKTRRVIVGPREELLVGRAMLRDINWLGDISLQEMAAAGTPVYARVRSTRAPVAAALHCDGNGVFIDFAEGEEGVAPGQACVLYEGSGDRSRVLGGGVITSTLPMRQRREKMAAALKPEAALVV
ncbi:MAG: tRNA 2-thiouridine(34) synthase MnmA [Xanthobacteraceae bacterium]|nr:tRNA 2-thiouridine(34) synthase MnmA [Xanthobacteraceae bacterium]